MSTSGVSREAASLSMKSKGLIDVLEAAIRFEGKGANVPTVHAARSALEEHIDKLAADSRRLDELERLVVKGVLRTYESEVLCASNAVGLGKIVERKTLREAADASLAVSVAVSETGK